MGRKPADRRTLYENFTSGLELPTAVRSLETTFEELQTKLENLDLSEVDRLKAEYDAWRKREDGLFEELKKLSGQEAELKLSISENKTKHYLISRRTEEAQAHWDSWKTIYPPELWDKAERYSEKGTKRTLATKGWAFRA